MEVHLYASGSVPHGVPTEQGKGYDPNPIGWDQQCGKGVNGLNKVTLK